MAEKLGGGLGLRIVSDGTPMGTKVIDEATGNQISLVQSITWHLDSSQAIASCDVQLAKVPADLRGQTTLKDMMIVSAENLIVPREADPAEGDESAFFVRDFDDDPVRVDVERHSASSDVLVEFTVDDEHDSFYLYKQDQGRWDVEVTDRVPVESLIPLLEACGYAVRRKMLKAVDDIGVLRNLEELTGVKVTP